MRCAIWWVSGCDPATPSYRFRWSFVRNDVFVLCALQLLVSVVIFRLLFGVPSHSSNMYNTHIIMIQRIKCEHDARSAVDVDIFVHDLTCHWPYQFQSKPNDKWMRIPNTFTLKYTECPTKREMSRLSFAYRIASQFENLISNIRSMLYIWNTAILTTLSLFIVQSCKVIVQSNVSVWVFVWCRAICVQSRFSFVSR